MPSIEFTMGADPELALVNDEGRLVSANRVSAGGSGPEDRFGVDGCGAIAEIRPEPATSPLDLVRNIRTCLEMGARRNRQTSSLIWKAGSNVCGYPLGGHLHFGIPLRRSQEKFGDCLDTYVAQPIVLLEETAEATTRRGSTGYGRLSDIRQQTWGFEYRTLSSWITSPYVAAGVLCLTKAVMHETLNHDLNPRRDSITLMPLADTAATNAFNTANRAVLKPKINTLWANVVRMELYPKYQKWIDFIKHMIDADLCWHPRSGLRAAWGISKTIFRVPKIDLRNIWGSMLTGGPQTVPDPSATVSDGGEGSYQFINTCGCPACQARRAAVPQTPAVF